eukprot:scaffold4119_cov118-Isochrysis_galbana.AAC.2
MQVQCGAQVPREHTRLARSSPVPESTRLCRWPHLGHYGPDQILARHRAVMGGVVRIASIISLDPHVTPWDSHQPAIAREEPVAFDCDDALRKQRALTSLLRRCEDHDVSTADPAQRDGDRLEKDRALRGERRRH